MASTPGVRSQQRDATRERIVAAAVKAFADKGFRGASTRDIARRARTNQGLITYHFRNKDALWRAAVERLFGMLERRLIERISSLDSADPRERARAVIREYVRFTAAQPELFRIMVDAGTHSDARMKWLVDTHVKPRFEALKRSATTGVLGIDEALVPHAFYSLAGASSLFFGVAAECRQLTGIDPRTPEATEAHAEFVARMLVP